MMNRRKSYRLSGIIVLSAIPFVLSITGCNSTPAPDTSAKTSATAAGKDAAAKPGANTSTSRRERQNNGD